MSFIVLRVYKTESTPMQKSIPDAVIHTGMYIMIFIAQHCQTGNSDTWHCMMPSGKAFCAVPFKCAADLQWNWHTFPLQITIIQYHIIINYDLLVHLSHSVVYVRPSLQGLTWFELR